MYNVHVLAYITNITFIYLIYLMGLRCLPLPPPQELWLCKISNKVHNHVFIILHVIMINYHYYIIIPLTFTLLQSKDLIIINTIIIRLIMDYMMKKKKNSIDCNRYWGSSFLYNVFFKENMHNAFFKVWNLFIYPSLSIK